VLLIPLRKICTVSYVLHKVTFSDDQGLDPLPVNGNRRSSAKETGQTCDRDGVKWPRTYTYPRCYRTEIVFRAQRRIASLHASSTATGVF
jgi:hypothetical protein